MESCPPWLLVGTLPEVISALTANKRSPSGGVYTIEFDSGVSKIGCSRNPASRVAGIARTVEIYGGWKASRVAISCGCTNFYKVESELHRRFATVRVEGELFRVSIEQVGNELATIQLIDETDRQSRDGEALIDLVEASMERAYYAQFGESEAVVREDDEIRERMSEVVRNAHDFAGYLALDICVAMGRPTTWEEKGAVVESVSRQMSEIVLSHLGPRSAYVIFEAEDGYRFIDAVTDLDAAMNGDPRGRICEILRNPLSAP